MANFGVMKITNLGLNLFAKAQTGTQILFTKMQSGNSILPPGTVIETLTQLISPDFDVDIESITIDQVNHIAKIKGTKDNIGMLEGVFSREIGLFANDPDVGEVLYAYANAGEYPDYIPPESSGPYTKTFAINAAIGNAANVTAVIPLDIYVSQDTFNDFKDETSASLADYTKIIPYGGTTTGVANTYAIATPTISALTTGMAVSVKININSTGASTLNWDGKGAKTIKKADGTNVTNLKSTGIYTLRYDGTNFILQGEGGEYGTATQADVKNTKTIGTSLGVIQGTLDLTNLTAGNIKKDIVIDGITGTLVPFPNLTSGSYPFAISDTDDASGSTSYGLIKSIRVKTGGTVTVSFSAWRSYNGMSSFARVYINGIARGIERSVPYSTATTWTEDFNVNAGDYIQIYGYVTLSPYLIRVGGFRIKSANDQMYNLVQGSL
ncbi:MAG: hypothetical protein CVV56_08150 [Tenericutes bacterium HGW-Tenericutes-1]|jgi:hypothetical protein|nr:MAG: hypothetical protein CVV56_08150 [Tenericutes bacterium HGW-Tenericutes-1]PKM95817.1 MAG: hypothetical protein CVU84_03180 [Firmicutes bacterium HGW-Firmicutes-1]